MKTISMYKIYQHAYNDILALWANEKDRNDRFKAEHGRDNSIALHRIEKYSAQLDELHEALLQMENEMSAAANA